ncbi:MAG: PEGA domain-containing protein [Candidatus Syntropharchaeia archaeon]
MKKVALAVFLTIVALSFSKTYVLIIGSGSFNDPSVVPLPGAVKDACTFKKTVIALRIAKEDEIIYCENPTGGEMKSAILSWANLAKSSDDELILYYSGHGYSRNDQTYIIPKDVNSQFIEDTAVNLTDLLERLKGSLKTSKVVVIMDACYAGSLIKDRPLRLKRYEKDTLQMLSSMYAFLLSSKGNQTSRERQGGGGWFTYYLIKGMQGEANEDEDEKITLKELAEYVMEKVKEATSGNQTPVLLASADVVIAKDMSGVYKEILVEITRLWTQGKISEELFKIYARVLNQPPEEDTEKETKIREYLVKYHEGVIDLEALTVITRSMGLEVEEEEAPPRKERYEEKHGEKGVAILKLYPEGELIKGAKVYIDGKLAGKIEGELFNRKIEAGEHEVLITSEKIEDIKLKVSVEEYEVYEKKIRAEPAKRVVEIDSEPQGAYVYIDGEKIGTTPTFVKLEIGKSYKVEIRKRGYFPEKKSLYIPSKGSAIAKSIKLQPYPKINLVSPNYGEKMIIQPHEKINLSWRVSNEVEGISYEVYVDGDKVASVSGKSVSVSLEEGWHKWKVMAMVKGTRIWSGESEFEIRYKKVEVHIDSYPSGAEVYISEIYRGTTPLEVYLEPGEYTLKLKKEGYRTLTEMLFIASSEEKVEKGYHLETIKVQERPEIGKKLAGSLKWKFKTGDNIYSSPAIGKDGTIYVGSWDNYLYAINPDGSLKWKFETDYGVWSSPAIGEDGIVYANLCYFCALNPDGSLKWRNQGEDPRLIVLHLAGFSEISSPAIGDKTIYVGVCEWLYAVNPDGSLKWRFETGGRVTSGPAIDEDGTIYILSDDGYLYAINIGGGLKWRFKISEEGEDTPWAKSSPAIGKDGTIYVGSWDNYLYAISQDGTLKWKFRTGDRIYSSPAIGKDGTIYIGSNDNYLYAISSYGMLKWKFKTGGDVRSSPTICPDGTIYVGSDDGYLYAIYSDSMGPADSSWPMFRHDLQHTGRYDYQGY